MSNELLKKILEQLWDERLKSLEQQYGDALSTLSSRAFDEDVALKALQELEFTITTRDAWLRYLPVWAHWYGRNLPLGKKVPKTDWQNWLSCYMRITFYSKAAHGTEPEDVPPSEKDGGIKEIIQFLGLLCEEQINPPQGWIGG